MAPLITLKIVWLYRNNKKLLICVENHLDEENSNY